MPALTRYAIGASVTCTDGVCGEVARVVVDPVRRSVTHLVIEPRGRHAVGRVVPVELIGVEDGAIALRCSCAHWRSLPYAQEIELLPTIEPWPGYPDGGAVVGQAAPSPPALVRECVPAGDVELDHAHASDGALGRVEGVLVDPADQRVSHVLLAAGHFRGRKDVAIPIAAVERFDADGVHVALSRHEIARLPAVV